MVKFAKKLVRGVLNFIHNCVQTLHMELSMMAYPAGVKLAAAYGMGDLRLSKRGSRPKEKW